MNNKKLHTKFYQKKNVLEISKLLLGKILVTKINDIKTSGMIVETEAYAGIDDKASHAYRNKITDRTKTMYLKGGVGYVYLCYGIHYLFNVVTNTKNIPHAILIRALEPFEGINKMCKRRNIQKMNYNLSNGPGKLSSALGINKNFDAKPLTSNKIWIEDIGIKIDKKNILSSPRIGVDYAGKDAKLPYRYYINNNKWVSK